jgi:hypothetical protein
MTEEIDHKLYSGYPVFRLRSEPRTSQSEAVLLSSLLRFATVWFPCFKLWFEYNICAFVAF